MQSNNYSSKILYAIGVIPVIWFSLLIAPNINNGLIGIVTGFNESMQNPLQISMCENSFKSILIFLLIYILSIAMYDANKKNYRRREEHGSAKWGSTFHLNSKYEQKPSNMNKILTQHVSLGLDGRKHKRNLNVLVIGGSGSGKTRSYVKPNILQANNSFVVLDCKGEILRDTGNMLKAKGYEIKILDLINMENSFCYNPFVYLKNDNDVQKLITNYFKSTTPKNSTSQDPFWDVAAQMLLSSLIFYLKYEAPEDEQNFVMVLELLRAGEVNEDDDSYISPLDILMNRLEIKNPEHIAVKYYKSYRSGSAKTLKSIQLTLASRLEKFNLDSLAGITQTDELELSSIGEKKTALFALIPDNDSSFNFLVSILYTQLFQELFYLADHKYGGSLPIPVDFEMDEFANVCLPDDFDKALSVMRSRGVSVSIILQNLSQLKALFEKQWESIVGNCDTLLYLGGNEQSTHEYISKLLGKETIDINSYGKSNGKSDSYSTNLQSLGRELLTPDEVRRLDNNYSLLFIRGEEPIKDFKFDINKHKNIKNNVGKEYNPYKQNIENSIGTISIDYTNSSINKLNEIIDTKDNIGYEILSDEELEDYLSKK